MSERLRRHCATTWTWLSQAAVQHGGEAMTRIHRERLTADPGGDFVVFLIGMRINAVRRVHQWVPVFRAMTRMLRELSEQRDSALLGFRARYGLRNLEVIQYWRSFDELRAYARDPQAYHLPAWASFNRTIGDAGAVGIWHETYLVDDTRTESVYRNMPLYGLAAATSTVPARGRRRTAAGRLGRSDDRDPFDDGD